VVLVQVFMFWSIGKKISALTNDVENIGTDITVLKENTTNLQSSVDNLHDRLMP